MEVHERYVEQNLANGETNVVEQRRHVASEAEVLDARANRNSYYVWYIAGVLETLLGLRFLLKLFGAASRGFAAFIYNLTSPLVAPFNGVFAAPSASGSTFDSAAVLAILVIALVAWGIVGLIDLAMRPTHSTHRNVPL